MAAPTTPPTALEGQARSKRPAGRWLADRIVLIVGVLVLVYTFVPIGYIIGLSFNQPSGRSATAQFEAFTLDNWTSICEPDGLCDSLRLSIMLSLTATLIATVLGTMMAFALVRHSFRYRTW
jgi:spermidine/putrescine transport system permease protein